MSMQALTYAMTLPVDASGPRLLLFCIAHHVSNETGATFVGQKRLADEARVSVRSVRRYIADLEAEGIVKCTPRRRDNGSQTTDIVELVGFLDWLNVIENGGVIPSRKRAKAVDEPEDNLTSGEPGLSAPRGHLVSAPPGHCCPPLNQNSNQENLTNSAHARAKGEFPDLKNGSEPKPVRPAIDLTPADASWQDWLSHIEARGHEALAQRAREAGLMQVPARWPERAPPDALPNVPKPPKSFTDRMLGETAA